MTNGPKNPNDTRPNEGSGGETEKRHLTSAERQALYAERAAGRRKTENLKRKRKKIGKAAVLAAAVVLLAAAGITLALLAKNVFIPQKKYNDAAALFDAGEYMKAYDAFIALGDYKDAADRAEECILFNARALSGREDVLMGTTAEMPWFSINDAGAIKLDEDKYKGGPEVVIPDVFNGQLVRAIDEKAFYYADFMTAVVIPASVTRIGERAFFSCTALESVTLPAGVEALEDYAFAGCTALKTAELGESLKTVGQRAFRDCASLETLTIPAGVTRIASRAFNGCEKLRTLSLPASLEYIGEYAATGCTSLEAVLFSGTPDALASLCSGADGDLLLKCAQYVD